MTGRPNRRQRTQATPLIHTEEGGPIANLGAEYFNDFTDSLIFTNYGDGFYAPGCWARTVNDHYQGKTFIDGPEDELWYSNNNVEDDLGYAIISVYKDLNETTGLVIYGYTAEDTYYACYAFRGGLLAWLQEVQQGTTTILLEIDYTELHPVRFHVVESLGPFTECTWFETNFKTPDYYTTLNNARAAVEAEAAALGICYKLVEIEWCAQVHPTLNFSFFFSLGRLFNQAARIDAGNYLSNRQLLVSKIENGIVIDHIPAGKAFQVLKLLKLPSDAKTLTAQNVDSGSMGAKDLIKIEGTYLTSSEIDIIAFVAPNSTLNIIQDWDVKEKRTIELPEEIEAVFHCPNTLCPTNQKYSAPQTKFKVERSELLEETKLHCTYCGSITYYGTIRDSIKKEEFRIKRGGLVSKEKIEQVFLDVLLKGGALRFPPSPDQPFILKSGRPSPYFVNLGALTDGESLAKVKWAFASYIAFLLETGEIPEFDYIFGPSYKGISLAALTTEGLNELYGMDIRYMYDRKEVKNYGDLSTDRVLVGASYFKPGQRILVVDDTITTGITKVDTIEKLKLLGDHEVVGLVIAVDRQERLGDTENIDNLGAVEYLEKELNLNVHSIQNIKTIYGLIKDGLDDDMRELWLDYNNKYGITELE